MVAAIVAAVAVIAGASIQAKSAKDTAATNANMTAANTNQANMEVVTTAYAESAKTPMGSQSPNPFDAARSESGKTT